MSSEDAQKSSLKQKVAHEFEELAMIFLYLAFFFCSGCMLGAPFPYAIS